MYTLLLLLINGSTIDITCYTIIFICNINIL